MLTIKQIDAAKPKDRLYKLSDIDGLYLAVLPTGTKSWRCNYVEGGKQKTKTFGKYPDIPLSNARLLNAEFKVALSKPAVEPALMTTFDDAKKQWYQFKLPGLKNIKHKANIIMTLDTYVSPVIGHIPIGQVKRAQLVEIVKGLEAKGTVETAHRVGNRMRMVFDYAVDSGVMESHPAAGLSRVIKTPQVKHMSCVDVKDAGKLFRDILTYDDPVTRIGLMLLALTMTRTVELRHWRWDQIIPGKDVWVVPGEIMKMKIPHVVPLSRQTKALLREVEPLTGDQDLVVGSLVKPNHSISENTLLFALYRLGYRGKMTGHGFRALASTVLNQESPFAHDVIERQLAHQETDKVRAAYNRAEYLDERVKMMQWWADWIDSCQ